MTIIEEKCTPDKMKALAQFAIDRFSYPYDEEKIARITTRIIASAVGFGHGTLSPSDNAYICSEYVYECYKRIDLNITPDKRGFILPADFAKSKDVDILFELHVEQK